MEQMEKEYTLSLYNNLSALRNSPKSRVFLVQNEFDGKIYIKKELKTYNIEVFKALKEIKHKNMPRLYEYIELDNTLYIIEEFINGDTLEEILKHQGTMAEEQVIGYVLELCDILSVLHNKELPIIHRDIKPSNIIISNDNVLKLVDFDVSRIYKDEGQEDTYILGTKGYASPEQFGFDQTDCRSDIYSLGVLMNVLTTGDYPKNRRNSGKLSKIIERCTHIAAEKRYKDVIELSEELKKLSCAEKSSFSESNRNSKGGYEKEAYDKEAYLKEKTLFKDAKVKVHGSKDYQLHLKDKHGNRVENKVINFINELPGFRGGNPIKMILAICWYLFMVAGILISFSDFNIFVLLEDMSVVTILLVMTFFNGNYKNIKMRLPIINSSNRIVAIFALLMYNFILFMIGGGILVYFQGLH